MFYALSYLHHVFFNSLSSHASVSNMESGVQLTVRQSLFRTLLVGILITALLIVTAVWRSANTLLEQNISQDITVTGNVLDRLIEDRKQIINPRGKVPVRRTSCR